MGTALVDLRVHVTLPGPDHSTVDTKVQADTRAQSRRYKYTGVRAYFNRQSEFIHLKTAVLGRRKVIKLVLSHLKDVHLKTQGIKQSLLNLVGYLGILIDHHDDPYLQIFDVQPLPKFN